VIRSFPRAERYGMTTYGRMEEKLRICRRVRNIAERGLTSSFLPIRMEQLGYYWTEFYEILFLRVFSKICLENSSSL